MVLFKEIVEKKLFRIFYKVKVSGSGFWVPDFGFGIWVSGFGFRVPDFGFWVPGFRFRISGSRLQIQDSRLQIQDSRFQIPDSRFQIQDSDSRFQIPLTIRYLPRKVKIVILDKLQRIINQLVHQHVIFHIWNSMPVFVYYRLQKR